MTPRALLRSLYCRDAARQNNGRPVTLHGITLVKYSGMRAPSWAAVLGALVAFHATEARAAEAETSSGWVVTSFS